MLYRRGGPISGRFSLDVEDAGRSVGQLESSAAMPVAITYLSPHMRRWRRQIYDGRKRHRRVTLLNIPIAYKLLLLLLLRPVWQTDQRRQ